MNTPARRTSAARLAAVFVLTFASLTPAMAHAQKSGVRLKATPVVRMTTAQLMALPPAPNPAAVSQARINWEPEMPDRNALPQAKGAPLQSHWPARISGSSQNRIMQWRPRPLAPQSLGTAFTGATLADAGAFPTDCMGSIGPTQFVVFINGLIRTFNKSSGLADGVLNAGPDVFF
ncbi:MAG: hypothetical protein ACRDL7_06510, partial [Gaiellaceae bacterium]